MITFSSTVAKGKFVEDKNHHGHEPSFIFAPTIPDVNINETDGYALLKLLHLPRLGTFTFDAEQLPAFKSAIQDHLGFDQPLEKIANSHYRYDDNAVSVTSYFYRKLRELYTLVDTCIAAGVSVEWIVHP
jgi:hypothetical protein